VNLDAGREPEGAHVLRDLASLLAPLSEETFLEHFIEKKRMHVRSADPTRAAYLFPWTTINQLIASDVLPTERVRVLRANIDLLPAMFRDPDRTQRLSARRLQALLRQGASLIINDLGDLVPQIGRLSDAIERRLGQRVWINAYLSFGRGNALKAHWDGHDVLVLQVYGKKRWRSYGTPVPFPVAQHNAGSDFGTTAVWQDQLEPGDVLYLPRGEVHDAVVDVGSSVHLTIGIESLSGIDFLGWLAKHAASDELARRELTRLSGGAALQQHEARFKERLHRLIDRTSFEDYFAAEDRRRKPRPLLSLGIEDRLEGSTLVIPTPRRSISISWESESEVDTTIGGETYRLSQPARRVLVLLLARHSLAFSQLIAALASDLGEKMLRDAVLELVRQGLVGLLPKEFLQPNFNL
jgi:ribosomal protein L16 Arg81 hydroxylase